MIYTIFKTSKLSALFFLFAFLFFAGLSAFSTGCQKKEDKWVFEKEIKLENVKPNGIVYSDDYLWISDTPNSRILKINMDGKIEKSFNNLKRPMHLSFNNGKIYFTEFLNDSIKVIDNDSVKAIALKEKPDAPASIDFKDNTLAVADFYNHRIILQRDKKISNIGREGHSKGELFYPTDVSINDNLIYVADAYNNRVEVFNFDGKVLKIIGAKDKINVASGIFVNEENIFVTDFFNNRIFVYDTVGNLIQKISGNSLNHPSDICVSDNKMYVTNYQSGSVFIYSKQ